MLAHTCQLQQNAREPPLTMIEKLITKVFLKIDVPHQKRRDELFAECTLPREGLQHRAFLDAKQCGRFQRDCRADSHRLSHEASFAEKVTRPENHEHRFSSSWRNDGNFYFPAFDEVDGIRQFPLGKDTSALRGRYRALACSNRPQQHRNL